MSFVHLSLLTLGGLFVAVPIALHLAMRRKPRHQLFPTLRFLQQRQATNQRRLRLRHAALLLLRCLVIVLLALALARPSVDSAQLGSWLVTGTIGLLLLIVGWLTAVAAVNRRGWRLLAFLGLLTIGLVAGLVNSALALIREKPPMLLGDRQAAVAAVLIIDTSPRMLYRYSNQSRLQRAQEVSQWVLRQFPIDSQVAVIDSSTRTAAFSVDASAAVARVDALETTYLPQPLSRLIEEALRLLRDSNKQRKEMYIVSDLTRATWEDAGRGGIAKMLEQQADVSVQVIDVGVEQPSNTSLADVQPARSLLTPGSKLEVRARVARAGKAEDVSVQLFMETAEDTRPLVVDGELQTPQATVRGRQTVSLSDNGAGSVLFTLSSLDFGTHHGYVELEGVDGLSIDNRQHFTVHVRKPWSILVVSAPGAEPYFLTERLAPLAFREQGRAKFVCTVVSSDQIVDERLSRYDAIGILDPPPLTDATWQHLQRYLERGGGVAVFLGRNARSATDFDTDAALAVLPAGIQRQWKSPQGVALAPRDYDQPLLSVMREIKTTVPWEAMPIFQHWVVGNLRPDAQTLIAYSNNKPALLERQIGRGTMMLLTTPISDPDVPSRPPWNLLPTSLDVSWPFMILVDRLFLSLVQSNDAPLNYFVGQPASLSVDAQTAERFSLFTPLGTWQELTSSRGQVHVPFTEVPGTYRLNTDPSNDQPVGFSVKLPAAATRLERSTPEQIEQVLGVGRFQFAKTEADIVRDIDQSRVGREFYPFLLPLLVVILALEYVTANRFYPESP